MPYAAGLARAAIGLPHKIAQGLLLRDLTAWIRVEFLGAAARIGLIRALAQPGTSAEIAARLGLTERDLLESFLTLGASLGELARDGDRWKLKGTRAKALADPALDGMAGMVEEAVGYDSDVYLALTRRLRGEPPGDYLAEAAETVARASRLAEVVLTPFVRDLVRTQGRKRVLDVGCGTGVYLRASGDASATLTGTGVDIRPEVVDTARRNLDAWGLAHRFTVREADAQDLPDDVGGPWDLVLLFQNIYYFPADKRPELLRGLRQRLAPGGVLAVATAVADAGDPLGAHLDIVLRSTVGNYGLPTREQVREALTAAGFSSITERRLAPRQPVRAFVAR